MKQITIGYLALMLIMVCHGVGAQTREEKIAKPHQHKKKIYVDEKENYIYWPMDMPFWVRLTASPHENAPAYLLQKVHPGPGSPGDSQKYEKQGIKLEITGKQFIRWYNVISDKTTYLKFYADGDVPVVEETMEGAPLSTRGEHVFYGKGLKCTISAKDQTSGVENIYLSIDGAEFEPYENELSFDKEKDYYLRFYALDHVGYFNEPKVVCFTVDLTPAKTNHAVHHNYSGNVLSSVTTIQLTSADQLSGVKSIYYQLDPQSLPCLFTGENIKLDHLADGEHVLTYYSVDKVQNQESKRTYTFYLDKIPPTLESRFEGDHHHSSGIDYISPRTRINLSALDNKIGVEHIEYEPGQGSGIIYSTPFSLPYKSGKHAITYRAFDKLGNKSSDIKLPVRMDDIPPVSQCLVVGPRYQQRDTIWITKNTTVQLSAGDNAAGLQDIRYQLGEKTRYQVYAAPLTIPEEGRYLFKFYGTDNVNNQEPEHAYILVVDNTAPEIIKTFSVPRTGTLQNEDGTVLNIYPRFTSLFLGTMDNSVGIAGVWYSLNGKKEQEYTKALVFNKEGRFMMKFRSTDHVGNTSNETLEFVIKD